jgi:hypothetical protein
MVAIPKTSSEKKKKKKARASPPPIPDMSPTRLNEKYKPSIPRTNTEIPFMMYSL